MTPAFFHLKQGRRYRIRMHNASDDIHPSISTGIASNSKQSSESPHREFSKMWSCWEAIKRRKSTSLLKIQA